MNLRGIIWFALLLFAGALDGHSAAITWNTPQNITGDSDVSTNGTFLYAEGWAVATTVNGVNFAYDSSSAGDANVGISFPAPATDSTVYSGDSEPWKGLSTAYKRLVRQAACGATSAQGGTSAGTITLKGLQAGIAYQVQLWVNDDRAAAAGSYTPTRSESFGSAGGSSVSLVYYVGGTATSAAGGMGQYVIGTFLADATTQTITVTASNSTASGTSSVQLNAILVSVLSADGTATVQYGSREQHIDGFGASSAWISSWTVAQADLFFSTNPNGIGLSLLRSRIAPDGSTVESSIMQMAQARGATVWSTPWSPPASDKDSGTVDGGDFVSSTANYQSYAAQLAGYVSSMRSQYGVNIYAVSVQNEPDVNQTYESCLWTGPQIDAFVPYLSSALASAGMSSTKIMLPESESWSFNAGGSADTLAINTLEDPAAAGDVGILAAHDYGSSAAPVTLAPSTPLWETEHYFGSDDSIQNGLDLAQEIHSFMTVANANAYHYWWLYGSGNGSLAGNSTDTPAKRLYVMGNYSKFVRPGFYRVDAPNTSGALVSAYIDPASSNYVIVAANPTAYPILQTFNVSSCPSFSSLNDWVTSATLSLASQPAVSVSGGVFSYALPAYTVVTFTSAAAPAPLIVLNTSDTYPSSSFNTVGNWDDTNAPNSASNYNTAQYAFRTPSNVSNAAFAGNSLTVPLSGLLVFDGPNGQTGTFNNLILDGGGVFVDTPSGPAYTLAGQISVKSNSFINPGFYNYNSIAVSAPLNGSGALSVGNGGIGTLSLLANNSAFTGPIDVNSGATLTVGSASNLGGNPQLTLDNATFVPTASLSIPSATLGPGGGTVSLGSGITLTIANPVAGSGALNLTGSGTLVLNGVTAGGTVTVSSGAALTGKGAITGATTVSGTLAPASGSFAFGNTLSFGASAQLQFPISANAAGSGAAVTAAASASITSGATVIVSLNAAGSSVDFSNAFWGAAQSWPVLTAPSISGAFTLGGVSSDIMGRPASWFGAFSLQQTGAAVNLVWTPAAPWQQWRAVNFGANYSNPAVSGPGVVTAGDGMTNLMKYALGLKAATPYPPTANIAMGTNANDCLQMTVTKNPAATDLTFAIQATSNIANASSWSSAGVTIDQSTSSVLQAHVTTPMSAAPSGFMRLMVTQP